MDQWIKESNIKYLGIILIDLQGTITHQNVVTTWVSPTTGPIIITIKRVVVQSNSMKKSTDIKITKAK